MDNDGRRTWWDRLRAWNRRTSQWMDEPPWRNGLIQAVFNGVLWSAFRYATNGSVSLTFIVVVTVLFFGAGMVAAVARTNRRAGIDHRTRSSDAPPPADPLTTHDGRRWRSGIG